MQITLKQLRQAKDSLSKLATFAAGLPMQKRWDFSQKFIPAVERELASLQKMDLDLFKKHGETPDNGQTWQIKNTNAEALIAYNRDLAELLDIAVELPDVKFTLDELSNAEANAIAFELSKPEDQRMNVGLNAFDFGAISFLIEDAEPKAEQVTPIKQKAKAA
jgi:hypothetical protein